MSDQGTDGWEKKTLLRLTVDLKNDYAEIKGFSVRNMQCVMQLYNEYNQEFTMVKGAASPIAQPLIAQLGEYNFTLPIKYLGWTPLVAQAVYFSCLYPLAWIKSLSLQPVDVFFCALRCCYEMIREMIETKLNTFL